MNLKHVSHRVKLMSTPAYYSPKMLQHNKHIGTADDIWALGVSTLGMAGQWSRVLYVRIGGRNERRIDEYPRQCWGHAGELAGLNPGHGIVALMERMLAWRAEERITAGELRVMAEGVQEGWERENGERGGELGVKALRGFQPVEFRGWLLEPLLPLVMNQWQTAYRA